MNLRDNLYGELLRYFVAAFILAATHSSIYAAEEIGKKESTLEAGGENLLTDADGEREKIGSIWKGIIRRNTIDAEFGSACLEMDRIGSASLRQRIKIDPSKHYEICGKFKSGNPNQLSRALIDVRYLTADGEPISPRGVTPASSVSVVSEDAKVGDTKLKVAKKDWPEKISQKFSLVLGAQEDLSDLPNPNIARISQFVVGADNYEITLSAPLTSEVRAGTGVRLTRYTDHPRVWNTNLPTEWTELKFRIGETTKLKFWPGAEYAEIMIIHQNNQYPEPLPQRAESPRLLLDDISFREIVP